MDIEAKSKHTWRYERDAWLGSGTIDSLIMITYQETF